MIETIRPSSDLRNHYNEISNELKKTNTPTIITVNGRGDSVLMGIDQYNRLIDELELLKGLAEAEDDVRNDRISEVKNGFDSIKKSLEKLEF